MRQMAPQRTGDSRSGRRLQVTRRPFVVPAEHVGGHVRILGRIPEVALDVQVLLGAASVVAAIWALALARAGGITISI